jgi:hypothetical protein
MICKRDFRLEREALSQDKTKPQETVWTLQ